MKLKELNHCVEKPYTLLSIEPFISKTWVFIATGDINSVWTCDPLVQMTVYLKQVDTHSRLHLIIDGTAQRHALKKFHDPHANAYECIWKDPNSLGLVTVVSLRPRITNSTMEPASWWTFLFTISVTRSIEQRRPWSKSLSSTRLWQSLILGSSNSGIKMPLLWETQWFTREWQWSAFRRSDDACRYGNLVSANIDAAASLLRSVILNEAVWQSGKL